MKSLLIFFLLFASNLCMAYCDDNHKVHRIFNVGFCIDDNTTIQRKNHADFQEYWITYRGEKIRFEIGNQHYNWDLFLGNHDNTIPLHNLKDQESGNYLSAKEWIKEDGSIFLFLGFHHDGNTYIDYYSKEYHSDARQSVLDFMNSLFLICHKDEEMAKDFCTTLDQPNNPSRQS